MLTYEIHHEHLLRTDSDPKAAAQSLPDKHIVKMPVEAVQMLVSACLRHGVQPNVTTKSGTVHKGGYHNHPSTVWAGDNYANAFWTWQWGIELCAEYTRRYGKTHFAEGQCSARSSSSSINCLTAPSLLLLSPCPTSARPLTLSSPIATASASRFLRSPIASSGPRRTPQP